MFASGSLSDRLSVCIRCQYRLAMREHAARRSMPPQAYQRRRFQQTSTSSQEQALAHDDPAHTERPEYLPRQRDPNRGQPYRVRRINLYNRDLLGMDSLGRPAEALIVRGDEKERDHGLFNGDVDTFASEQLPLSATELLERINDERGIVGEQRVAENLEDVKSTWFSELQEMGRPREAEYRVLAQRVHHGFTAEQLADYYGQRTLSQSTNADPEDLSSASVHDLYIRSAWNSGTTTFPETAAARLASIRKAAARRSTRNTAKLQEAQNVPYSRTTPKVVLVDKILRTMWRLRTIEDEEALGEIDILPRRENLGVLLNHRKAINL